MSFCCKNCKDRKVGCHSYCKTYEKDKEEYNRKKEIERKERSIDSYMTGSIIKNKDNSVGKWGFFHKKI